MESAQRLTREVIIFFTRILWERTRGLPRGGCGCSPPCVGSVHGPAPIPPSPPHTLPHLRRRPPFPSTVWGSFEASGAANEAALVRVSKLPQLSGHVESHSFAVHEKLKSRPDRMEGSGWGTSGKRSHRWPGRWQTACFPDFGDPWRIWKRKITEEIKMKFASL